MKVCAIMGIWAFEIKASNVVAGQKRFSEALWQYDEEL